MDIFKRVFAQINLNHIEENLKNMQALVGRESRFLAVIKTDGYGHGAVPVAEFLEGKEALYGYAVATIEEALELRGHHIKKPILVLGYTFPEQYSLLTEHNIIPTVFREDSLQALSEAAVKAGRTIPVHIKVDTGMSRIGVSPDEVGLKFVKKVLETKGLEINGIFTHFARADEEDKSSALAQFKVFNNFVSEVEKRFRITIPLKHCANSAGILELRESSFDLVRAGIALYGLWPSDEMKKEGIDLKPALSLYSHVVYIKEVPPGTPVSYGGTFVAEKTMRIATIPVGYGDGYPRSLSGIGYVLIRGKKAPILGRICMDQFMVDVTDIPEAHMDDAVTLIGKDGSEEITLEELGRLSGRLHYELVCDLGKRIPRVYMYNGAVTEVKNYFDRYRF